MILLVQYPCKASAKIEDIVVVSGEKHPAKSERSVEDKDICPEEHKRYRLTVTSSDDEGYIYFQFENRGAGPTSVHVAPDEGRYLADYPSVEVFFKADEDDPWSAPVMNPGTFIPVGLERVRVGPGDRIAIRAPVVAYLPKFAGIIKLQLRFDAPDEGAASCGCISSMPFRLPIHDRKDSVAPHVLEVR